MRDPEGKGEGPLLGPRGLKYLSASLLLILLITAAGTLLLPGVFRDRFIHPYLWGPVLADAGMPSGGAAPGYNPVNTLLYGAILIISLIYIHLIFVRTGVRVGREFLLAISPVLLAGPLLRVLEDSGFFGAPASLLFISPLIYIYLGLTTLLAVTLSEVLLPSRRPSRTIFSATPALITPLLFFVLSVEGKLHSTAWPFALLVFSGLLIPPLLGRRGLWGPQHSLALFSSLTLAAALLPVLFAPWAGWPDLPEPHPEVAAVALGGAAAVSFLLRLLFRHLKERSPRRAPRPGGINTAIIFGQTLDALATAWAVDRLGYSEKHVLPRLLISSTGTAFSMVPLKILLVILLLYVLDVQMVEEERRYPTLFNLIKLAILVLGLGPGLRDVLRASVGL